MRTQKSTMPQERHEAILFIANTVKAFLKSGGKIAVIPVGVSGQVDGKHSFRAKNAAFKERQRALKASEDDESA